MSETKPVTIRMPKELYDEIKGIASQTGLTVTDIVLSRMEKSNVYFIAAGKEMSERLFEIERLLLSDKYPEDIRKSVSELGETVIKELNTLR